VKRWQKVMDLSFFNSNWKLGGVIYSPPYIAIGITVNAEFIGSCGRYHPGWPLPPRKGAQ
jgi:hypothetical protein